MLNNPDLSPEKTIDKSKSRRPKFARRFITVWLIALTSVFIVGFGFLGLLYSYRWAVQGQSPLNIFKVVQMATEIIIGLAAILIAARVWDGLWRQATLVLLVPFAGQRLIYLFWFRNEEILPPFFSFEMLLPVILLASLFFLPPHQHNQVGGLIRMPPRIVFVGLFHASLSDYLQVSPSLWAH